MAKSVTMILPQCVPWRVAIASDRSGDVAIIDSQNRIVGEFFAEVDRGVHSPADAFDRANLVCELVNNWDSVRHLARLLPLPETSEVLSGKVFEHSDPLYLMRMLESVTPRANTFAIENYVKALEGDGPLAYDWDDKPHRLVYDLVAAWLYQQKTIAKLCGAIEDFGRQTATEKNNQPDHRMKFLDEA